jgi:hypothetical protein
MDIATLVGSAGVILLLAGFFLNVSKRMQAEDRAYLAINLFGAALSCYASVLIGFMPFAILEGIWTLVAFISLAKSFVGKKERI